VIAYRDLTAHEELAKVVELERRIWGPGYDDVVPPPVLTVSVKRGGILIGAFDGERMIGFVYSLPAVKNGRPSQWSHMLGVAEGFRNNGVGRSLKLLQRERALAMDVELIEWTFDPMQALNAHLNFSRLGVVVQEYEENVYGESSSPLHRGNPTDRLVAEWWIREPRVARRLSGVEGGCPADIADARRVNRAAGAGELPECVDVDLGLDTLRLSVEIPTGFTEMLSRAPALALEWRLATRRIFTTYFARGYRAVEFRLDRRASKGAYLLIRV
jgi:predicted GNAT superfamily acetyltransferase